MANQPDFAVMGAAVNAVPALQDVYNTLRNACCLSIALWDWALCLRRERELIWSTKWTPIKVAYLVVRYWTTITMAVVVLLFSLKISYEECQRISWLEPFFTTIASTTVAIILAMRVMSVWLNDKRIIGICALCIAAVFGCCLAGTITNVAVETPPGSVGCISTNRSDTAAYMLAFYATPLVSELILLILMTIRTVQLWKAHGSRIPIMSALLKNQTLLFAGTASITLLNTAFFAQSNANIKPLNASLYHVGPSILVCHMVLNLRQQARDGLSNQSAHGITGIATGVLPTNAGTGQASYGSGSDKRFAVPIAAPQYALNNLRRPADYSMEKAETDDTIVDIVRGPRRSDV